MLPTDGLVPILIFSFLVSFGAVISPGPVSAAIISEAPKHGWKVGPLVAAGHTFLELIMVFLISFGLAAILDDPGITMVISLAGGVVLIIIGLNYVYGALKGTMLLPESDPDLPARSMGSLFGLGVVTTLANPYWYTWWVTVAAGYLFQAQALGLSAIAAFYLGHISADFFWDTSLGVASHKGGRWISKRGYRILIVITGILMLYFGVAFIVNIL